MSEEQQESATHRELYERGVIATTDGQPPARMEGGAPGEINPASGQHRQYWVLSEEERAKGFIRPVRETYIHVGIRPTYPTRELTDEEKERYGKYNYVAFEEYPAGENTSTTGRFWTKRQLESGCNSPTSMSRSIAETYARDPKFYGSTFCVRCRGHFPVGEHGEFVWAGTSERVGS